MGYHIEFSDIVKYEGDAIVNSLGVKGNVYGRLCRNIVEADKSNTIKNIIDKKLNNNLGDIFITPSGDLKCDNVIHVVTPFRHMDDDNLSMLKKAYKGIIDLAILQGYKTLALPFIGTGANGYSDDEAYVAIEYVCDELIAKENASNRDILDVTVIGFLKAGKYNLNELRANERYHERNYRNLSVDDLEKGCGAPILREFKMILSADDMIYRDFEKCSEAMSALNEWDFIKCKKSYTYPYDFILDYFKQTGKTDENFAKAGYNADRKYKLSIRKAFKKKNIFKLAYLCGMNLSQLVQFMLICEVSFNPSSQLDLFMIEYFSGRVPHIYTIHNFAGAVLANTGVDLFQFKDE